MSGLLDYCDKFTASCSLSSHVLHISLADNLFFIAIVLRRISYFCHSYYPYGLLCACLHVRYSCNNENPLELRFF
ncbi:hypothetical protein K457DRAFT_711584 [Linnemannia elongata AG-77]|uniref:Uncharacterized protein n=1 Tax=Linnemannia elongata AG-77 TaxID=1314771 RepID=A0A197KBA5_9FUNG|nr:hypothetical protein K457DRAFT_711584 [Linnemannia elongata AG-77]